MFIEVRPGVHVNFDLVTHMVEENGSTIIWVGNNTFVQSFVTADEIKTYRATTFPGNGRPPTLEDHARGRR